MQRYLLPLISLTLAIGCGVSYNIIGSEIAPDGTLIEPFFLIPLSYLFLAISVIFGLGIGIRSFLRKTKKIDK